MTPEPVQSNDLDCGEQAQQCLGVIRALAYALTASDVKQVILHCVVPLTGAYAGTIVREVDSQTLLVFGAAGYDETTQLTWQHHPSGGTFPVTAAIREKRPVFATRAQAERDYPDLTSLLRPGTRAVAAIPLLDGAQVLAGLTLSFADEAAIDPQRQAFILALVQECAPALTRARRFDAEHQARERATLLAEAGEVLSASLEVRQTLDRLMALAISHVADWAAVYLPGDQGSVVPVAVAHRDPALVELLRWFVAQYPADPEVPGSTAWVMRTGESFLLPTVPPALIEQIEDEARREAVQRMGFHSLIHVPLIVEGRTVGVLGLATSQPQRTYGAEDLRLAQALAARAALALGNAQQYQASRQAEERYRSLVDATRQTVWTDTPDGQMVGEQPGWSRLTGQTEAEYGGYGWMSQIHPDDLEATLGDWQRAVATQSTYEAQQRVRVADGTYRHFDVRAVPVFTEARTVREWVGVHTDITERVRAEEELRQSEGRFRRLVGASPTGIAVGGIDGTLRFPNDAYLRMLGFSQEEFDAGQMNWAALTPAEYREADERAFRQVFEFGMSEPYEKEMVRRDGSRFPTDLVLTRYEQHDETFVVAYVQDLTVQKEAERTLRNHSAELELRVEERTRALEEQRAALDAFVTYTEAVGTETATAELAQQALHVLQAHFPQASAAYYEPAGELWHARVWTEDMRGDVLAMIQAGVSADLPLFAQTIRTRREVFVDAWDPERERVEATDEYGSGAAYPLIVGGELTGLLLIGLKDIQRWSERDKALVRAVGRSLNLALERGEQTSRLEAQRAELDARAQQLQRSNAELERFAYVASHDLQEPLRTIASFTGLLERRYVDLYDERGRTYLGLIVQGAARMKTLLDDLLVFSRLGDEKLTLEPVPTSQVVEEALDRLRGALEQSAGQVTYENLPTVQGNALQLIQLLQNLIGNALKFCRPGVLPQVRIGAQREDGMWHFTVTDNGIGIEPQYFEKIFVMFQRLHVREQYSGTGLGLAICLKVVERHGGQLWVESQPGSGSTFHFTLRAAEGSVG